MQARSSFFSFAFGILVYAFGSLGCAGAMPGDEIMTRIHAEREHCEQQEPRGSARCWFDLAAQRSLTGDAYISLDDMSSVMKAHGLTFSDIGVTANDVDNVKRRGHLEEAKRSYETLKLLAPRHEVSMYTEEIYRHIAAADVPPRAIEPGLTFDAIRSLERLGDLSEARNYLRIARENPHSHTANAAVANIRRLLGRSKQSAGDIEEGLSESALDDLG